MSGIEFVRVTKRYGGAGAPLVIRGVDFTVPRGTLTTILGPSGCGKTTLLRMVAGLDSPSSGRILIDGRDVTDQGPAERNVCMVFQSYALFPHLSVIGNVGYGLSVSGVSRDTTAQRARAASAPPAERPILHPGVAPTFAGEAAWTPGPVDTAGRITTETTWFRPDPTHPTVVVGALWIDQRATALHLIAGTREPGHGPWPGTAQVPLDQRSTTVAAFNSGFLLRDSGGAFYEAGRRAGTFLAGGASVVIDRSGHATLGAWGRDVGLHRTTYAVRQNLHLIVDHGRPVPGLVSNGHKLWGSRKSQLEYTWRSALGIDGNGNLVYVAGNHLTLTMLADALTQAGSVRAMQLDIHPPTTTANLFLLGADDHRTAPVKLLPGMNRPADRYLAPDQRDFFTVTVR